MRHKQREGCTKGVKKEGEADERKDKKRVRWMEGGRKKGWERKRECEKEGRREGERQGQRTEVSCMEGGRMNGGRNRWAEKKRD